MLLKLIKEIADLPHITYLLSLDRNHVANAINHYYDYSENDNYGFEYLDKFVQLWWAVPIIDDTKISDYFTNKILQIVTKDVFETEEKYFYEICKKIIFYNDDITLRKLKLLINSFTNNFQKMSSYTNFCDLLAYTWLQLFYPDLLTIIVQNVDLLLYDRRQINGFGLTDQQKADQEKEKISNNKARFDSIAKSKRKEYFNVLYTLFPILKYNLGIDYTPHDKKNEIMRFLICTDENFKNYFYQNKSYFIDIYNEIETIIKSKNVTIIANSLEANYEIIENFTDYIYLYCNYKKLKENELFPVLQAYLIYGNKLQENESSFLIGNFLDYFTPSQEKSLKLFIDVIDKTTFTDVSNFLILLLNSFIVSQNLLPNYNQNEQTSLLDSFYNQLSKTGYKSDKILNYRRICNIFSTPNRTDLIIKSFNISITFLIAYIINVYVEFNYKSNTNGNLSFSNYYINNTSGSAFNIDNFWNFINSSLTQTIKIKSTEIKLYKHTPEFNNLEKKDQNIIETYIREFNL